MAFKLIFFPGRPYALRCRRPGPDFFSVDVLGGTIHLIFSVDRLMYSSSVSSYRMWCLPVALSYPFISPS
jgi:hypothetical protein